MYSPSPQEVAIASVAAGVLAGLGLVAWPWSRAKGRFWIGGVATIVAVVLWRLVLLSANGENLDIDGPVLGLSFEDVGSGVLAFTLSSLALVLATDRRSPAWRVAVAALIAGGLATVADRFL